MNKILITLTKGTNDPVMATLPLEIGISAAAKGHDVSIALLSEAVYLMKSEVTDELRAMGCTPMKDVLADVIKHKIPIHV